MMKERNYRFLFWILLAGVTAFRLAIAGRFGLSTDESHYACYIRYLDWGYFDHPPMVAFLGTATTLFGPSVFLLRLGPILCSFLSLVLLRELALELYGQERVAFWATVAMLAMPVQHLLGMALLPDATLNLFWCATLLAVWRAIQGGKWGHWAATGFFFGSALMSKYHGALLPLCILGFVVAGKERRRWLWSIKPYVAGMIGFALFLPNIYWNYKHAWISYAFQLGHGGGSAFSVGKLFESIGGQLIAASPVLFVLLALVIIQFARKRSLDAADSFVFWTSAPVLVFFCGIGCFGKVLPHWPAVAWWTGVLGLTNMSLKKISPAGWTSSRWGRWCVAGGLLGLFLTVFMYAAISYPVVGAMYERLRPVSLRLHDKAPVIPAMPPYRSKFDLSNDLYGWREAARTVEAIKARMPKPKKTFVFCHRFFSTSQLAVWLEPETMATSLHRKPSQYRLWFDPEKHKGWDALFVDTDRWPQGKNRYLPLFERVDKATVKFEIDRHGRTAHKFRVYRYYGFKGKNEEKK